jgi:hypothetical protein
VPHAGRTPGGYLVENVYRVLAKYAIWGCFPVLKRRYQAHTGVYVMSNDDSAMYVGCRLGFLVVPHANNNFKTNIAGNRSKIAYEIAVFSLLCSKHVILTSKMCFPMGHMVPL